MSGLPVERRGARRLLDAGQSKQSGRVRAPARLLLRPFRGAVVARRCASS